MTDEQIEKVREGPKPCDCFAQGTFKTRHLDSCPAAEFHTALDSLERELTELRGKNTAYRKELRGLNKHEDERTYLRRALTAAREVVEAGKLWAEADGAYWDTVRRGSRFGDAERRTAERASDAAEDALHTAISNYKAVKEG